MFLERSLYDPSPPTASIFHWYPPPPPPPPPIKSLIIQLYVRLRKNRSDRLKWVTLFGFLPGFFFFFLWGGGRIYCHVIFSTVFGHQILGGKRSLRGGSKLMSPFPLSCGSTASFWTLLKKLTSQTACLVILYLALLLQIYCNCNCCFSILQTNLADKSCRQILQTNLADKWQRKATVRFILMNPSKCL